MDKKYEYISFVASGEPEQLAYDASDLRSMGFSIRNRHDKRNPDGPLLIKNLEKSGYLVKTVEFISGNGDNNIRVDVWVKKG